jgi:hypothetical protein
MTSSFEQKTREKSISIRTEQAMHLLDENNKDVIISFSTSMERTFKQNETLSEIFSLPPFFNFQAPSCPKPHLLNIPIGESNTSAVFQTNSPLKLAMAKHQMVKEAAVILTGIQKSSRQHDKLPIQCQAKCQS